MAALDAVVTASWHLDLLQRYQHDKPDVIAAATMEYLKREEKVVEIIRAFNLPNEAIDELEI